MKVVVLGAGVAVLDILNAGRIGLDVPFMPPMYRPHPVNWRASKPCGWTGP